MRRLRRSLRIGTTAVSVARAGDGRGRRLVVSRPVDAPADAAWTLLVDTGRWPEWGPSVRGVESSDRRVRTGTTGRVRTPVGAWLPFEVTAYDGDGGERRWRWRVAGVPATEHRVVPGSEEGACRVEIGMPLAAALYAPVCALALANLARVAAEGRPGPE